MAEAEYNYEVMRAELLGLTPPDRETFMKRAKAAQENNSEDCEVDDHDVEVMKNVDTQDEVLKRTAGGLEELNSILAVTQKKLNKFKVVCGSLTNLLKIKGGKDEASSSGCGSNSESVASEGDSHKEEETACENSVQGEKSISKTSHKDVDVQSKVASQVDKLDAMLMKAEQADLSLSCQNKQLRSLLHK